MAEVAGNIESKVSIDEQRQAREDKVSKDDLAFYLQEKVSLEDLKKYVGGSEGAHFGGERQNDFVEEELNRLRQKLEDTYHQVQSLSKLGGGPSSSRDLASFQKQVDQKFIEVEEKLTEKANK